MNSPDESPPPILVTARNKRRLEEEIQKMSTRSFPESGLDLLRKKLSQAKIIGSDTIPRNCVTMGSTVSIVDLKTSERLKFCLVYPEQADYHKQLLSVFSPLGACIFGHQVGDEPIWEEVTETGHFTIAKVDSQPEASSTYTI